MNIIKKSSIIEIPVCTLDNTTECSSRVYISNKHKNYSIPLCTLDVNYNSDDTDFICDYVKWTKYDTNIEN